MVASNVAYKTRIAYFAACLERDATFYDEHSPSEMPSKIAKECSAIELGCGQKVGQTVRTTLACVFGFAVGFYLGWQFTLILMASVPVMCCVGGAFVASM